MRFALLPFSSIKMSKRFTLRWNDFHVGIANSFRKLRNAEDFYDVTLVSDDQQQVSAHKIVVAAASGYFENILKKNQHSHPLLCLEGIAITELKNIVDYIYNGELEIYQDYLDTFLHVAKRFQIEGLIQREDFHIQSETAEEEFYELEEDFIEERSTLRNENIVNGADSESDIQMAGSKNFRKTQNSNLYQKKKNCTKINLKFDTIEELNEKLEAMIEKENYGSRTIGWKCKPCGKPCRSKGHAMEHVEIHVEGLVFHCKYCSKPVHTRTVKRMHESKCKWRNQDNIFF